MTIESPEHQPDQERLERLTLRAEHVINHYLADHPDEMLRRKVEEGNVTIPEAYQLLKDLARDPKTGVQRSDLLAYAMDFELYRSRETHEPLAVVVIDIDHFKQINSELSHLGADEVLREVALIIDKQIRTSDDRLDFAEPDEAVTRWGGEEFVVLFPATSPDQAATAAERIRAAIQEALQGRRPEGREVTVSIGLTGYDGNKAATWQEVLKSADEQLFIAKQEGRNTIRPILDEFKNSQ